MDGERIRRILTINSGSSSVKFSLFRMGRTEARELSGAIDRIGLKSALFRVIDATGKTLVETHQDLPDHDAAFDLLFSWLSGSPAGSALDAAGHRIVHGGSHFLLPHIVTQK